LLLDASVDVADDAALPELAGSALDAPACEDASTTEDDDAGITDEDVTTMPEDACDSDEEARGPEDAPVEVRDVLPDEEDGLPAADEDSPAPDEPLEELVDVVDSEPLQPDTASGPHTRPSKTTRAEARMGRIWEDWNWMKLTGTPA